MLVNVGTAGQLALLSRTFCAPLRVTICVASLQERLGLTTKDADFSAVWLTRDHFEMTFLDQLGLMDLGDILELSKGLSKIGAKIFEVLWFKLRTSKSPFSFLDKLVSGKQSTSSRFACTYIRCYLFFTRS